EDAEQVLERIRRMWPNLAPNQLQIQPPAPQPDAPQTAPSGAAPPAEQPDADDESIRTTGAGVAPSHPLLVAEISESVALFDAGESDETDSAEADADEGADDQLQTQDNS